MIKDTKLSTKSIFCDDGDVQWQSNSSKELSNTLTGLFHIYKEEKSHYKLLEVSFSRPYLMKQSRKQGSKVLDITNAVVEKVHNNIVGEGLIVQKNNLKFFMYGQVDKWLDAMQDLCIQVNFHEDYFLYRLISNSQQSKVYFAEDRNTKIDYAIKVFEKNQFDEEIGPKALKQEIEILRLLKNEHFTKLLKIYEGDQAVYLVFEQQKGGDLQRFLKENENSLTEKTAFQAIKQLLQGINLMHTLNYMHRDLKPENILLKNKDSLEELIISDLGLAERVNNEQKPLFTLCGTPGYVGPEVLKKQPYDQKVDIYGIGIILYTLLTGKNPFQSILKDEILELNMIGYVNIDKVNCSELGRDLLKQLLQLSPNRRPTAQQALRHQYFQNQSEEKVLPKQSIIISKSKVNSIHSEQLSPLTPNLNFDKYKAPQIQPQYLRQATPKLDIHQKNTTNLMKKFRRPS
ncbi:unnamed protein product (macronuclear) [Paramecium tetraurelia]|uniref:Protein kinase domain-containing protein n=1 Tax=Paramecium tetraurelia TaxID=5888 RepID=A0EEC5_PARTE|nr:uncharacterized protein GSPATT00025987001 [Paramecium tetraurelia]CAK93643.1 unnamed protein product [Paramecium tetraurelia]|eukprot:XP_001461039.1 hypothetical protein (macronuclear) [Paramecium tetraurelia strain d4-2]